MSSTTSQARDARRPNMLTMKSMSLAVLVFAVGACRQNGDRDASRDTGGRVGTDTGMAGMEGMRGGASAQMMADGGAHLEIMRTAMGDSMKAMLPMHRQMVANMIAQLDREMRDMNMTGDAAWNATLDSLRQDLRVMPE